MKPIINSAPPETPTTVGKKGRKRKSDDISLDIKTDIDEIKLEDEEVCTSSVPQRKKTRFLETVPANPRKLTNAKKLSEKLKPKEEK